MAAAQLGLFDKAPPEPPGFAYRCDFIDGAEEAALIAAFADLPFREFEFHGFLGKRRTVSFGLKYDFGAQRLEAAPTMPPFLDRLKERAAAFAGVRPADFAHALVTEYQPGVTIGWHRDRPQFDKVFGLSLASSCTFRFRRRTSAGFERISHELEPRSAYLLDGPARREWEHSIPPVQALRYSVTLRTLRGEARAGRGPGSSRNAGGRE